MLVLRGPGPGGVEAFLPQRVSSSAQDIEAQPSPSGNSYMIKRRVIWHHEMS